MATDIRISLPKSFANGEISEVQTVWCMANEWSPCCLVVNEQGAPEGSKKQAIKKTPQTFIWIHKINVSSTWWANLYLRTWTQEASGSSNTKVAHRRISCTTVVANQLSRQSCGCDTHNIIMFGLKNNFHETLPCQRCNISGMSFQE